MATAATINWRRVLGLGAFAGIQAGIALDLVLYLASVRPQYQSMLAVWQFIASTAVGKTAFTSTNYAWLGLAMHFAVSVAWAAGYAYLAQTKEALNAHPFISGTAFGVVVYVVMQIVLVGDNNFHLPSGREFFALLLEHITFGIIVASVVRARSLRP